MTNEEAIEVLNNWDMACPICEKRKSEEKGVCADCRFNKALNLAIKTLEEKERPKGELLDYINQSIEAEKNAMTDYHNLASEEYHKGIIYAFECMKMKLM